MDKNQLQYQKDTFLDKQLWDLAFDKAIEPKSLILPNVNEGWLKGYQFKLKGGIEFLWSVDTPRALFERSYVEHIQYVQSFSEGMDVYTTDKLPFGAAQMLLNLYFKFMWTMGKAQEPPHFPVDNAIQEALGLVVKEWFTLTQEDYKVIIEKAKEKAKEKGLSLAEWELEEEGFINRF